MIFEAKYNTAFTFEFPVIKRGVVDFAASGDWSPATGDTKISKDGGNVANTSNNPSAVGGTGSILWTLTLTSTEMQAARVVIQIVDSATKAVEDQSIIILTYGNASAHFVEDRSIAKPSNFASLSIDGSGRVDAGKIAGQSQTGSVDIAAIVSSGTYGLSALKTILDTIAGYIDTEVAAIKAKTDSLPADTASTLATIAGYIDTEVAAILAAVDTEIAAIKAKTDKLPNVALVSGAVVDDAANTASVFKTNLAAQYKHAFLTFTSGALNGETARISSVDVGTGFATTSGFSAEPSAGDTFDIINK
jgi:hypothetical protein